MERDQRLRCRPFLLGIVVLATAAAPLAAQGTEPSAAQQVEPVVTDAPTPVDCAAVEAERTKTAEELHAVKEEIGDIAMGKSPRKRKGPSGGAVARGAAQTAAGILLPFPFGVLVGAGAAAAKQKKPPAPSDGPDVPALIEQQRQLEARLAELAAADCG